MTGNFFAGELPSEISNLRELRVFRIDENDLTGSVPDDLCTTFDQTQPVAYADCDSEIICECCSHCCTDGDTCTCIVEDVDPIRCAGA